ncbi:MAG: hypothetical protein WB949_12155 [Candidatus Acidiferrales bacterium]
MRPRFQFVPRAGRVSVRARGLLIAFLAGIVLICPLVARAQGAPSGAIGRVEGRDISCENGTPPNGGTSSFGTSLEVSNGTVVTVHSGQAILTLFAGGEVDICGPAKFTVLLSGDAITLALNFGRVRVNLPANTDLRIFTPTIVGTPLGISGGSRDVSVGLSLDDSLCVLATSGAIQLEHQFSGEKLIVPQAGEFFLNAGRLLPVAGTPGSCQCNAAAASPAAPPRPTTPDYAMTVMPRITPEPAPASAPVAAEPVPEPEHKPNIEVSLLAQANEAHPIVPEAKNPAPAAPPAPVPVYTAVLPPLMFMAGSPTRPPDPTEDMVVLIREAKVSPEWEFSGRVGPPEFAQAMQHALGEKSAPTQAQPPPEDQPAAKPAKKKGGFWASLKRAFGGGGGQQD